MPSACMSRGEVRRLVRFLAKRQVFSRQLWGTPMDELADARIDAALAHGV